MKSNSVRNLTGTRKTPAKASAKPTDRGFGEQFALETHLGSKCRQLAEIEAHLAATQE
ncbi:MULTISPECIES: hypothetical protein [Agrobacterium tumefaciens complex]|uniref:Uncharacterized protein n=1 Tax=Agrobacterium tomkonis CFBP 6623 TaxID=1183432 RepID=A0A1S7S2P2_9HYPH|nr:MULTISPECIES: hypothetical protein [Agrobacterium tumefaciens complex]CUX61704.1 hypothetical protein AGR3A_Lc180148 [Agrobacterium tomkonis CFBP 6623]